MGIFLALPALWISACPRPGGFVCQHSAGSQKAGSAQLISNRIFQVEISPGSHTNAYFASILANPLCSSLGHFAFTADTINANDTARSILAPTGHLRSELTARAIYPR